MYSRVAIINNTISYLKVSMTVYLKSPDHKKTNFLQLCMVTEVN